MGLGRGRGRPAVCGVVRGGGGLQAGALPSLSGLVSAEEREIAEGKKREGPERERQRQVYLERERERLRERD